MIHTWLRCCAVILTFLCAVPGTALAQSDLRDPTSRYTYASRQVVIRDFVRQFAVSYGLRTQIDPEVARQRLNCSCEPNQPVAFLDEVARQNGFGWQINAETLYVYRDRVISANFVLPEDEVRTPKQIARANNLPLTGITFGDPTPDTRQFRLKAPAFLMGLYRAAFQSVEPKPAERVVERKDVDIVTVKEAGKSSYSDTSSAPEAKKKKTDDERDFMVFRLRYASAVDREYVIRDQKMMQIGVASMLQKLVNGSNGANGGFMNRLPEVRPPSIYEFRGRNSVLDGVIKSGPESLSVDPRVRAAREEGDVNPLDNDHQKVPTIEAYQETNSIIVHDKASRRDMYQRLIDALDLPPVQIEIRASIADVSYQKIKDWSSYLRLSTPAVSLSVENRAQPMMDAPLFSDPSSSVGMGLWSSSLLSAWINNLESSGDARVIAKPSVMTLDNTVAVLDLNTSAYVRLMGERVADLKTVTVGTLLKVTPRMVGNPSRPGQQAIHLSIEIEDGSLSPAGNNQSDPRSSRSVITTQALLNGADSLVIGGYGVDKYQKLDSKNPTLSRIPLLGNLFKADSTQETSRQRLFIITANIIRPNGVSNDRLQ